jgi:hypothetical protein
MKDGIKFGMFEFHKMLFDLYCFISHYLFTFANVLSRLVGRSGSSLGYQIPGLRMATG